MQKIFKTLIGGAILASTLSADIARVEMGMGIWAQTPSGGATMTDNSNLISLDGTYTSSQIDSSEIYVWVFIKHPLPIIPNLRVEYASVSDQGLFVATPTVSTNMMNTLVNSAANELSYTNTTIDMKQFDIIPYYNILDNTSWITVDLGLDIKVIQADVDIQAIPGVAATEYSASESVPIPLLYLRGRVQIPTTDFGVENDIKYITDGDSTVYDIRAKVDYTFDITPVIQPALEVGYRTQKYDIKSDDTIGTIDFSGFYAGLMLRF